MKNLKFVLVSREFGFDMFIADDFNTEVIVEKTDTAKIFEVGFDDEELKLKTYKALTGYNFRSNVFIKLLKLSSYENINSKPTYQF